MCSSLTLTSTGNGGVPQWSTARPFHRNLYKTLVNHWWWQGMYSDVLNHSSSCPQCAIVNLLGKVNKLPLQPIPVSRSFQILGVDIMDLPLMEAANRKIAVFQDFPTNFPLVFPVEDQKATRLVWLLHCLVCLKHCFLTEALTSLSSYARPLQNVGH